MRRDGKSQYTIKKEKLLKIKKHLNDLKRDLWECKEVIEENECMRTYLQAIWELVKNEK